MPTAFFADLVRETCQQGGTGPLMPSGAVPGHRRFADAVPAGATFHYAVAGIAQPGQWEVGLGRIDGSGRLARDTVTASSQDGARVDFAAGLKTIALTVGAAWFSASDAADAGRDAAVAELADAVAAKQPLSTTHDLVATGAAGDLITVRRGSGWANVPLSSLPFRSVDGRHELSGSLIALNGSAAAPSIGFSTDSGSGLFRPAANMLGFATGGAERLRITAAGDIGVGTMVPNSFAGYRTLHVAGASAALLVLQGSSDTATIYADPGYGCVFGSRTLSPVKFTVNSSLIWQFDTSGHFAPLSDNGYNIGAPGRRVKDLFLANSPSVTSDAREKSWRGKASDIELRAARRIAGELGFFQWRGEVEEIGTDAARRHFGVRAQAVWEIMADEGLIAPPGSGRQPAGSSYAFLCHDEWTSDCETHDRFGIRPDQLALFLIAAQEARIAALELAA